MATQDDINNLTSQIAEEMQSAAILEADITKEQQNSTQKVHGLRERADRHHETADRMQQELQTKQQQLIHEQQQQADEAKHASDRAGQITKGISRGLF